MQTQQNLFDQMPSDQSNGGIRLIDNFKGAMTLSAIGDALGWPTEFLKEKSNKKPPFNLPIREFVGWQKFVGGRWWGYRDDIRQGEYSDDTQLTLAVARSISLDGEFEPEQFAYAELPLWLHYERGGGRSIKTAARSLIRKKVEWTHNFYKQGQVDYRVAGANGAAMRNLPIALVNISNEDRLIRDSLYNTIITHGHPRAILGTVISAYAIQYALVEKDCRPQSMIGYICDGIERLNSMFETDPTLKMWVKKWEMGKKGNEGYFASLFSEIQNEAQSYLGAIFRFLESEPRDYYQFIGALDPATKGSGLGTACIAVYLFLRGIEDPIESLITAVNQLGSDTDTIASLLGALLGARYGVKIIPKSWLEQIQDRNYLFGIAARLHQIAINEPLEYVEMKIHLGWRDAYHRILAWEIGLHEMFWDAIEIEDTVNHPTLGKGIITEKSVRNIAREGYKAKLIHITFDCGQSCVFHSRVEDNDKVSASLGRAVQRALA